MTIDIFYYDGYKFASVKIIRIVSSPNSLDQPSLRLFGCVIDANANFLSLSNLLLRNSTRIGSRQACQCSNSFGASKSGESTGSVIRAKKSNQTVYHVIPLNLLKIYCEFKSDFPTTKPICLIKESQNVLKRQHYTTTSTIRILKATL